MKKIVGVLGVAFCLMLAGCASQKQDTIEKRNTDISKDLTYDHSMELEYAKMFAVDYYQNDYALVTIADDGKYLIVPEGESVPEDMDKDITVLQQPIQNIYLAASAAMDMFVATDALDAVRFSSLKADGWYIEEAKKAMEDGDIIYAGKYSAPDYEMILNENCGLAIENTMILHTPEVKEQMEKFNIPVLVDHSSYETNPLGRTEWRFPYLYFKFAWRSKIISVLFPFKYPTKLETLKLGGIFTSICTWSGHISASTISTPFLLHSILKIFAISCFIFPYATFLLYFGAKTI